MEGILIQDEVRESLASGTPVVALESTVLTHGLPRPRNLELAIQMERQVRAGGGVPATIAVLDGIPRIGLNGAELEAIALTEGALKLSTRDLPTAIARRCHGGTTVAATAWLARRAGIRLFATGGIGGVHRGEPRDVSPDLAELSRTALVVVCAGAKSILDLPATVEALETSGILTLGWRTAEFPAFYSAHSGLAVDRRVEDEHEVAAIWFAARRLGTPGALLLCVPPPPAAALPALEVEDALRAALEEAAARGVRGRAITPFLLSAIVAATGGRSLETNVALLLNNAAVATRVAAALESA